MNPILLQTMYYGIVMLFTFIIMEFLTQGFLHKFMIVFGSLGRKCFVKIRLSTYDGFAIGHEDEGFLIFKFHQNTYRIPIARDKKFFYRFLFVQWVDVDGEKWALSKTDYSPVSGYDPVKIENFLLRLIMAPKGDDKVLRLIIILLVVIGILTLGVIVFDIVLLQKINAAQLSINTFVSPSAQTVQGAVI